MERESNSFAVSEVTCPHCKRDFLINQEVHAPEISSVFTDEDVERNRQAVVNGVLKAIRLDPSEIEDMMLELRGTVVLEEQLTDYINNYVEHYASIKKGTTD